MRRGRLSLPAPVALLALVAAAFLVAPVLGLALRVPWHNAWQVLASEGTATALRVSLVVSTLAAVVCAALGLPLGWALARAPARARGALRPIVLLPLVLPPVVAGVGLLAALGRRGFLGAWLDRLGIQLAFTTAGAVVAATFVSLPLMVLAAEAGVRGLDARLEMAAEALGASPFYAWRRVTLPLLRPQLAAGIAVTWARALGEFGATLTFAGNTRGKTQTLPLFVFEQLQTDPERAMTVGLVLVALAVLVLALLRDRAFATA